MAIHYKCDILNELKAKGFSTYKIRKEKLLNESTLAKLRTGDTTITLATVSTICKLLNCQPSDIVEYIPDEYIPDKN